MKIKRITQQHRRDFQAIYECEHCEYEFSGTGYDDDNFHQNVIPGIECAKCGNRKRSIRESGGFFQAFRGQAPSFQRRAHHVHLVGAKEKGRVRRFHRCAQVPTRKGSASCIHDHERIGWIRERPRRQGLVVGREHGGICCPTEASHSPRGPRLLSHGKERAGRSR